MFSLWAVVLVLGVLTVNAAEYDCAKPTSSECSDGVVLACCDRKFRDALGFTTQSTPPCSNMAMYQDPECYRNNLEFLYGYTGTYQGIFTVCSEFYNYQQCLGVSYKSCTSAQHHIMHSVPYAIAELFATIFSQFNYACGAGLDTFLNLDTCMAKTFNTSLATLRKCRDEFYNNVVANPEMKCALYDQLTSCYERPFKENCGLEGGWWGCEYERIGISLFLPECSPRCQLYQEAPTRSRSFIDLSAIGGI